MFRSEIGNRAQPVRFVLVAVDTNGFTDVIRACVNIGPEQQGLTLQLPKSREYLLHLDLLIAIFSRRWMEKHEQVSLAKVYFGPAADCIHNVRRDSAIHDASDVAARASYGKDCV